MATQQRPALDRPRQNSLGFLLRRVGAHLWRVKARWGYLVVAFCLVLYAIVPSLGGPSSISDPLQQFLLILASVSVGGIVLPELPSALWTIDVDRVRNLIPQNQRDQLARTLINAESGDDEWNSLVWDRALEPLFRASREPWRYVRDLDYDISIHLNRELELQGKKLTVHTLAVDLTAYRVLARPDVHHAWISIVRTKAALMEEFKRPGCVARELTPIADLEGDAWHAAVRETCQASFSIDGEYIPLTMSVDLPDVVRFETPVGVALPSQWAKVQITFDTHMGVSESEFPVFFSGYYCAGTTDITLRLYDENDPSELTCNYFVGKALDEAPLADPTPVRNGPYQRISFSTGKDSILWPGSGVRFAWQPRTP